MSPGQDALDSPPAALARHVLADAPGDVVIFGAGDLGHSLRRMYAVQGISVRGFVDDRFPSHAEFDGLKILGSGEHAIRLAREDPLTRVGFAIGYRDFSLRAERFEALERAGVRFARCLHPSAVIDPTARVGRGVVAFAGVVVDHGCVLADDVLLNTGAVIAHDSRVERHAFISPGAILAGFVHIGPCAWIGLGAKILECVRVGAGAIVAAGAVVRDDVAPFSMVAGVPAVVKKALPAFDVGGS